MDIHDLSKRKPERVEHGGHNVSEGNNADDDDDDDMILDPN